MNIAFVGKGGSGKTTVSSLFISYLALRKQKVLAIDGDINQHLQGALGFTKTPPPLSDFETLIASFVKGNNVNIRDAGHITRSTPPGPGSELCAFDSPLFKNFSVQERGITLMRSGEFHEDEVGMGCYHGKIIPLEILLNHLSFSHDEFAVVDMTAGADMFSTGMFLKFDVVVIVVEPTIKSVSVYQQFKEYLAPYQIPLFVVGNKVNDSVDVVFLTKQLGFTPLVIPQLPAIRARERGEEVTLEDILHDGADVFAKMYEHILAFPDIQEKRLQLLQNFHRTLSAGWYMKRFGYDLSSQIS